MSRRPNSSKIIKARRAQRAARMPAPWSPRFTPEQYAEIDRLIERRLRIKAARLLLAASHSLYSPRRGGCG